MEFVNMLGRISELPDSDLGCIEVWIIEDDNIDAQLDRYRRKELRDLETKSARKNWKLEEKRDWRSRQHLVFTRL